MASHIVLDDWHTVALALVIVSVAVMLVAPPVTVCVVNDALAVILLEVLLALVAVSVNACCQCM